MHSPNLIASIYCNTNSLFFVAGDMTFGVYKDSSCQYESSYSYEKYLKKVSGSSAASSWSTTIDRWNSLMSVYMVCQPCRAYNKVATYDDSSRFLAEDADGEGEEEQWGYNCYDDAGYQK